MHIDQTHDQNLQSWVDSSNRPDAEFPIQNLPYCVFSRGDGGPTVGVGIGDQILDLRAIARGDCLRELQAPLDESLLPVMQADCLNPMMGLSSHGRQALRQAFSELLSASCPALRDRSGLRAEVMVSQSDVRFHVPAHIRDYSDFYASLFHATNVGSMFRPDNPLLPNYKWIPIGYHGRASSIVISGTPVRRPAGQVSPTGSEPPSFRISSMLDYELEVGIWVAQGNELGQPIPMRAAEESVFGFSLVNDWSARDIQKWEYQPLGPFLAKSFATSVSPWVVTAEALAPFRVPAFPRGGDCPPLEYLDSPQNRDAGGFDIELEVRLTSAAMRQSNLPAHRLSCGSFRDLYWTPAQMIAHHTSNGCNLAAGDLLASGTVSGRDRTSRGCLLELTWDGEFGRPVPGTQRTPIQLPDGTQRIFLQDGDEVIMTGYCQREGYRRIGLGACRGTVVGATPDT